MPHFNRKTCLFLAAVLLVLACATGLWPRSGGTDAAGTCGVCNAREATDMTGRRITVPVRPQRILSLCTAATDTLVAIGAGRRIAAVDEYSHAIAGAESAAVIGRAGSLSREQVLARRIDLAFVWWYGDDVAARLTELGVPVVRIRQPRASGVPEMIRIVGECAGEREAGEREASRIAECLAKLAESAPPARRPTVYLELYGASKTVGVDSYMSDLLELAGGKNVVRENRGAMIFSPEALITADPAFIVTVEGFATAAEIAARPGMAGLSAVKAGRIWAIPRRLLVSGPSLPEAVAAIHQILTEKKQTKKESGNAVPSYHVQ